MELVETFEDPEAYYVVTKFMPAGSMHNYLKKQKSHYLTEAHVKKLVIQVALGVQEIHSKNIVHRDIKLENLLMSDFSVDA